MSGELIDLTTEAVTEADQFGINLIEMQENQREMESLAIEGGLLRGEGKLSYDLSQALEHYVRLSEKWEKNTMDRLRYMNKRKKAGTHYTLIIANPEYVKLQARTTKLKNKLQNCAKSIFDIKCSLDHWKAHTKYMRSQSMMRNTRAILYGEGQYEAPIYISDEE